MGRLHISLFGSVHVVHDGQPRAVALTHHSQALLGFLVLYRHRAHSREVLSDLLWGSSNDVTQALACLRTTLWRLRRVIEPPGTLRGAYLVTTLDGAVGFNGQSDYWLDVATFEQGAYPILSKPIEAINAGEARAAEGALQLYVGDLLEGFHDEWALRERERLRCLYLDSLTHLMSYYAWQGVYEHGLECGRRILGLDPLREDVHREMMRLYHCTGQRPLVVQQYDSCRQVLESELGIAPMRETQALYDEIMAEDDAGVAPAMRASAPRPPTNIQQTLCALRAAQAQIEEAIRFTEQLALQASQRPQLTPGDDIGVTRA